MKVDELHVFDLDGTLSDDSRRAELYRPWDYPYTQAEFAWEAYYREMEHDGVVADGLWHLEIQAERAPSRVVYSTARPMRYAPQTRRWMAKNLPEVVWANMIQMRQKGEHSIEAKLRHLELYRSIFPGAPIVWYDDRPDLLACLESHGVTTVEIYNPAWTEAMLAKADRGGT